MAKQKPQEITVKISPSIIVAVLLFGIALWLVSQLRTVLFMLFIAYIISVGLNKPIRKIQEKFHWQRLASTLLVYALFVLIAGAFLAFIVPPLIGEFSSMLNSLTLPTELNALLNNFELNLQDLGKINDQLGGSLTTVVEAIGSTFSTFFLLITTLAMSLYMSIDKNDAVRDLNWLTHDPKKVEQVSDFVDQVNLQLGNWIVGESILMLIVGGITFVGVMILGVPYPLPLALLAGLLEVIPNVGPTVSAIPAIILAAINLGWPGTIATLVLYIVIQQLENNLIVPRVMKKNVDVNGLTSILCILIGGSLFGVVGALLAVPLFIVLRTIFEVWRKYTPKKDLI